MTRTKPFHRFTARLLCLIMVLTLALTALPLTAFAATEGIFTYTVENGKRPSPTATRTPQETSSFPPRWELVL